MGEPALSVLRSAELKRRGIAAVEEALRASPSCLEWLLEFPAVPAAKRHDAIDADLHEQRNW
ncbi:MAG: hypothetical protein ACK55X_05065 [Synechococcaceae cyanobacterium]